MHERGAHQPTVADIRHEGALRLALHIEGRTL